MYVIHLLLFVCDVSTLSISSFLLFFFVYYGDHRDLHSFPTRRSSDLTVSIPRRRSSICSRPMAAWSRRRTRASGTRPTRSEEHTSELQSLRHLVCRLLLEKKKKNYSQLYLIVISVRTHTK